MTHAMKTLGLLVFLIVPAVAAGQTAARPTVEVGVEFSTGPDGAIGWSAVGPRFTANLTNRTALEVSYAPERDRQNYLHVNHLFAQMKRTLMARESVFLFGTLGVSGATRYYDAQLEFPQPPDTSWGPAFGFGAELPLFAYVRPRAEVQYVLSSEALLRFSGGLTVPVGSRFPTPGPTGDRPASGSGPAGHVRFGETVWVTTTDGQVIHGEVVSRSATGLTISHRAGVTAIASSSVQGIDVADRLLDGLLIGAGVGAAGGGALGIMAGRVWCENGDGCVVLGALLFGGLGGGIGTLAGAVVDSFRDVPSPVYRRTRPPGSATLALAPVMTARSVGAAGRFTW